MSMPMPIFSSVSFFLGFLGQPANFYVKENLGLSLILDISNLNTSLTTNYPLVDTGVSSFELIVSPSTPSSYLVCI